MNLTWAFGILAIGVAAFLGAGVYAGINGLAAYHKLFSAFAGSIGLVSFAVAAVGGIFAPQFHKAGWWVVLILVVLLTGVLLTDSWRISQEVQYGVVGVLGLSALYQLFVYPKSGIFLFLGVIFLVGAGLGSDWLATLLKFDSLNIYHALLSVAVLSFGAFAARE
ncbi:hypothetical protein [Sneathiella limimaris]|uniref:hypothetical protein n=1 Tax=Sneathiella limimaris TaxID=1964213 RepID=UPI00146E028C|nr:hypothetical protein [Sneathiella limimaris]